MPGPIGPPGYNGSQGPVGPQGALGPAGPKGSGDFSQCQYHTKEENKIEGSDRILVHIVTKSLLVLKDQETLVNVSIKIKVEV